MSDHILPELTRKLGLAVIERLPNAGYIMLAPAPDWLAGALGSSNTLSGAFPFLRHFLQMAGTAWHDGPAARVDSGPFEATINDEAMLLRATALTIGSHRVLVVERLTGEADPRPVLQRAREQLLEREQLERHARDVHAPAATVAREVAALAALDLPDAARPIIANLKRWTAALEAAVAELPAPLPRRRSSR